LGEASGRNKIRSATGNQALTKMFSGRKASTEDNSMNGIIYLVGLVVIVMAILSFLGLR
jgi:hypothetical protein